MCPSERGGEHSHAVRKLPPRAAKRLGKKEGLPARDRSREKRLSVGASGRVDFSLHLAVETLKPQCFPVADKIITLLLIFSQIWQVLS